jgi:hypothetical protein
MEARRSAVFGFVSGALVIAVFMVFWILLAFAVSSPALGAAAEPAQGAKATEVAHKYIGVAKCGMCHKAEAKGNQLAVWEKSKHAHAFETLAGEKALAIAKEKGLKTPPQQDSACLKCHVTGHGQAAELFEASFVKEMGIQCESCHGAGSDYKSIKVMKDHDAAIAAGLIVPNEAVCIRCHNEESPTFKGFEFKAMAAKIAHPKPKAAEK